jgi:DNA-binding transcriptional regulator YhcF (GntR family)
MNARQQTINSILKQQGYTPIFRAIDQTIRDFKRLGYSREEIRDTLQEFCIDERLTNYIQEIGY